MKKTKVFENKITHERYICENVRLVRVFDGVEYLSVRKINAERKFLIRKDSLIEVEDFDIEK
jgi:hypothetical protein